MDKAFTIIKMRLHFLEWLITYRNDQFEKLFNEFYLELLEELHNEK